MWYGHWGLDRDPFDDHDTPYVSLPSHDEALLRLVYSIEQGRRDVVFSAAAGLGKTVVLHRALAESRTPGRRVALIQAPSDGGLILGKVVERLGQPLCREAGLPAIWQALERAFRVAALQGLQIILALDHWTADCESRVVSDLHALTHGGSGNGTRLTIIRVGSPPWDGCLESTDDWALAISLMRLTRSQVDEYLTRKFAAVGCTERIFTPRESRGFMASRGVFRGPRATRRLESHGRCGARDWK